MTQLLPAAVDFQDHYKKFPFIISLQISEVLKIPSCKILRNKRLFVGIFIGNESNMPKRTIMSQTLYKNLEYSSVWWRRKLLDK